MVAAAGVVGGEDLLVVAHEAGALVAPLVLLGLVGVRVEVDEHLVAGGGHALVGPGVVSVEEDDEVLVAGDATVVDLQHQSIWF